MRFSLEIEAALRSLGKPYDVLLELGKDRELVLVGGTVRDVILGREPADFDFAVSGSGIEFARRYARKVRGKFVLLSEPDDQARVVVQTNQDPESGAEVQDRPGLILDFNGFGTGTIRDDLKRRDFTVNAVAYKVNEPHVGTGRRSRLLDPFQGRKAIRSRVLAPVSDRSLELDPLRLLRAFRLALELGFRISPEVILQARGVSLDQTAPERIGYELLRIADCNGSYDFIVQLNELGFLTQIFPGARPLFEHETLMRHSLLTYKKLEELIHSQSWFSQYEPEFKACFAANPHYRALLKLAGLFHDLAKPETEFINDRNEVHFYGHDGLGAKRVEVLARNRLRLSRADARVLKTLVEFHMRLHLLATGPELTDRAIRRFFRDLKEHWFGLMMLTFADGFATAGKTRHLEQTFARIIALKREYDAKVKVKRLVTGHDLIALGMKPGPAFKSILAELEELQIEGTITSTEQGLEYVQNNMERMAAEPISRGQVRTKSQ